MTKHEREKIIALIQQEVIPAIGCTEPIAVAYCVAKATEALRKTPEKITLYLSGSIIKNAMGVGIPGTDMVGLPIAIALGALVGKSDYRLEVLRDCTPEAVEKAKQYISENRIRIILKEGIEEKLYIETVCEAAGDKTVAIIAGEHTNFIYLSRNDTVLINRAACKTEKKQVGQVELSVRRIYEFAMKAPLKEIKFIEESAKLNINAAEVSLVSRYGHSVGKVMNGKYRKQMLGEGVLADILSYTSAACDARMAGSMVPVMTNSGSGNQGIAATLPVVVFAREKGKTGEELIRALVLSHLMVIYIKQYMGRLSGLCGCVIAATGSSCGITYLMGGGYRQLTFAIKNMIANLTGMICDGAKPSCSLKVASGVSTALYSAMLAMEEKCVSSAEGIIDEDVDQSIRNLAKIGSEGMTQTDKLVLSIMISK